MATSAKPKVVDTVDAVNEEQEEKRVKLYREADVKEGFFTLDITAGGKPVSVLVPADVMDAPAAYLENIEKSHTLNAVMALVGDSQAARLTGYGITARESIGLLEDYSEKAGLGEF